MSGRLYYNDAYLTRFDARVRRHAEFGRAPAVLLDPTAFYPASGGQPADRGSIAGIAVIDVVEADDGEVLHLLERALDTEGPVACEVDWLRRFDHMQQHSGQHVLSATLERMLGVRTESFHLGSDVCTIDVAASLSLEQLIPVEHQANAVVWENRSVSVRFVDEAAAERLPLRKPPARRGLLRLVEIDGVDLSACGGTHVKATGEIGSIVVVRAERYKSGTRIEFACGRRALLRHQQSRATVTSAAKRLSVAPEELPTAVEKLQSDLRELGVGLRRWSERAIDAEAERLVSAGPGVPSLVVRHIPDWDTQTVKKLASALASRASCVAVLIGAEAGTVVVACGPESQVDAGGLVRALTARFGGRGGGRREAAQAGGLSGTPDEILTAATDEVRRLGFSA